MTADDKRMSYYLSIEANDYIYSHDYVYDSLMGCLLISTDLRVEYIDIIDNKIMEFERASWNNQLGWLVVFSHEWALNPVIKDNIEALCKYARDAGYCFEFFEDILMNEK